MYVCVCVCVRACARTRARARACVCVCMCVRVCVSMRSFEVFRNTIFSNCESEELFDDILCEEADSAVLKTLKNYACL